MLPSYHHWQLKLHELNVFTGRILVPDSRFAAWATADCRSRKHIHRLTVDSLFCIRSDEVHLSIYPFIVSIVFYFFIPGFLFAFNNSNRFAILIFPRICTSFRCKPLLWWHRFPRSAMFHMLQTWTVDTVQFFPICFYLLWGRFTIILTTYIPQSCYCICSRSVSDLD